MGVISTDTVGKIPFFLRVLRDLRAFLFPVEVCGSMIVVVGGGAAA
jgi:hypothetical protein